MMKVNPDRLKEVFSEWSALNVRAIEREADLPITKLRQVMKKKQDLSEDQLKRLIDVLAKYGVFQTENKGLSSLLIYKEVEKRLCS